MEEITLKLKPEHYNKILQSLSVQPYNEVVVIINDIQSQVKEQLNTNKDG